jgi:glycosyltransferase involved in cell wall biosynthesis
MKANIAFVERIFPVYRKAVLDKIHKEKSFIFFHSIDRKSGIKQTISGYSSVIKSFYYGSKESSVYLCLLWKILRARPALVVHEFSAGIVSIPFLLMYCKLTATRLVFWGHMYNRNKGFFPHKSLSDKYRLWLWKRADSLITYTKAEREMLIENRIPGKKIFVAYNTVDTDTFLAVRDQLEEIGREELKRRLNFQHEFNLTFIGRLYKEKKPELLLDVLAELKQRGVKSVAVHFIGAGETLSMLQEEAARLRVGEDVFFHGAIYDEVKTGEMLFCSDMMIMPGCVGLSVNHAFCFNCPVVTFSQIDLDPAHGPEIEYIIDQKTGFLINDHSTQTLTQVVADYLDSPALRKSMRHEIRSAIEHRYSVDKMAEGVIDAINYNLKKDI